MSVRSYLPKRSPRVGSASQERWPQGWLSVGRSPRQMTFPYRSSSQSRIRGASLMLALILVLPVCGKSALSPPLFAPEELPELVLQQSEVLDPFELDRNRSGYVTTTKPARSPTVDPPTRFEPGLNYYLYRNFFYSARKRRGASNPAGNITVSLTRGLVSGSGGSGSKTPRTSWPASSPGIPGADAYTGLRPWARSCPIRTAPRRRVQLPKRLPRLATGQRGAVDSLGCRAR